MRSEREKGGAPTPGDSKGHSPWRFFGEFLIGEKVTQGPGLEAPPWGGVQRMGRSPSSQGECRGAKPLAKP